MTTSKSVSEGERFARDEFNVALKIFPNRLTHLSDSFGKVVP